MQEKDDKNKALADIRFRAEMEAKAEIIRQRQREFTNAALNHGLVIQQEDGRYLWAD